MIYIYISSIYHTHTHTETERHKETWGRGTREKRQTDRLTLVPNSTSSKESFLALYPGTTTIISIMLMDSCSPPFSSSQSRLSPKYLHGYNRPSVLVEQRLHLGQKDCQPFIHSCKVIYKTRRYGHCHTPLSTSSCVCVCTFYCA